MRQITLIIILAGLSLLLGGCSKEALYVDHEFGMATNDAFDRQIIHKDYVHAGKPVEGMAGIHAEPIMNTYQKTFSEGFAKEDINTSSSGTGSD